MPSITRKVPKKFCGVHLSPMRTTAITEASMGEALKRGMGRPTPSRSIPIRAMSRPRPGAKIPPTRKYQMAGDRKLDKGTKKGTMAQRTTAERTIENSEAVIALDVTNPRRFKMWATAKKRDACMARYSLMS